MNWFAAHFLNNIIAASVPRAVLLLRSSVAVTKHTEKQAEEEEEEEKVKVRLAVAETLASD